jgi:DNA invertase Pin-like site-specific DNA recombinase
MVNGIFLKRAIIYARESDDDTQKAPPIESQIEMCQVENRTNPELQCEIVGIFKDNGISGDSWNRPDYNKVVKMAESNPRPFEVIIVFNKDRIARNTELMLNFCRRVVKENKIQVFTVSNKDWLDWQTADGMFETTLYAALDARLIHITSEKVRKKYQTKKMLAQEKGEKLVWGRSAVPEEIKKQAIQLGTGKLTIAEIRANLPRYALKRKTTDGKAITNQVSVGWVSMILKQAGIPAFKNRGLGKKNEDALKNSLANQAFNNHMIVEKKND